MAGHLSSRGGSPLLQPQPQRPARRRLLRQMLGAGSSQRMRPGLQREDSVRQHHPTSHSSLCGTGRWGRQAGRQLGAAESYCSKQLLSLCLGSDGSPPNSAATASRQREARMVVELKLLDASQTSAK